MDDTVLIRDNRNELFRRNGTSTVNHIRVHQPDVYVTFNHHGRVYRVQQLTTRHVDGQQWRHQAQIIEYDPHTETYGAEETLGISLGDLARVLGESARKAFPGLEWP